MGHKCVLKDATAGSKPHLFMEPQELGIGVKNMKKVEKKAIRNEAEGGRAVPLLASSVGDQQEHRAGGRRDCVDQQAPHKGRQETSMVMPTQWSAWGAGAHPGTKLSLQRIAMPISLTAHLLSRRRVYLAKGHGY